MKEKRDLVGVTYVLVIAAILVVCNIYTMIPIYEAVANDFSIQVEESLYGSSFFTFFYAGGLLTFGALAQRMNHKTIIVFGLLLSAFTTFFVALSPTSLVLYITRSIQGFTLGSFAPVAFAYTFELFSPSRRTLVLALINTGFLIAGIVGQLVSMIILHVSSWEWVFVTFSFTYLGLFLATLMVLPTSSPKAVNHSTVWSSFRQHLFNYELLKHYLITFTLMLSFVCFYEMLAKYFLSAASLSENSVFIVRSVGLIGVILSFFTGRIIHQYGGRKTLRIGFILGILSLTSIISYPSIWNIAFSSIFFVAAISLLLPSIITCIGTEAKQHRTSAISLYSFILLTGASMAPLLVKRLSFNDSLLLLISLFVIDFILTHFLKDTAV
ncbi:MFS transporter [Metabacillus iocasae]|uniref:MFS family arabinose efflux permease n=1 Tax=Priestia iocasae TaxID=2291674 RepID=A0ABS2QT71_9BACI|nr:MFS transporter [Metabacillus iocasae]MBM7702644.1 putative MFS family arabinose efflux permease [Metabacillus iocasae]